VVSFVPGLVPAMTARLAVDELALRRTSMPSRTLAQSGWLNIAAVGGQVSDLLRGARALDRPRPGREIVPVVAGYAVLPERSVRPGILPKSSWVPGAMAR
jgi:hypothetical protein